MALKSQNTGASWPSSGTASTATTGLVALSGTGITHVSSTDVPPGSLATGYIKANESAAITVGVDAAGSVFSGTNYYHIEVWCKFVQITVDSGTNHRIIDVNGNGNRTLISTNSTGGGHNLFQSVISGGGTVTNLVGAATGTAGIVPLNRWTKIGIAVDSTTGNGSIKLYVNDMLVSTQTGINYTGNNDLGEIASPAFKIHGCETQISGPIRSYDADPNQVPMTRTVKDGDRLRKAFSVFAAGFGGGANWPSVSLTSMTVANVQYATSGTNPLRSYLNFTPSGTGSSNVTSVPLGVLPYNPSGWCSIVFPMTRLTGTGVNTIAFRNTADDADIFTAVITATTVTVNGVLVATYTSGNRVTLVLHPRSTGRLHATVFDQTNSGTSQYAWSADCGSWTAQEIGPVVQRLTAVDAVAQIDGLYTCDYLDVVGIDSLSMANVASLSPEYAFLNRVARYFGGFGDHEVVPNSPFQRDDRGVSFAVIAGRTGRNSTNFDQLCNAFLQHSRAVRMVRVDGGSINDLTGVISGNRLTATATWQAELTRFVSQAVINGNRVWLSTMIRREQGTYTALQNREIDTRNGFVRELARAYQRTLNGVNLIELTDVAKLLEDHVTYFTAGDNVHFNAAGEADYIAKMVANTSSVTGDSLRDNYFENSLDDLPEIAERVRSTSQRTQTDAPETD